MRTLQKRPELLLNAKLDQQDKKILLEIIDSNEIHIPEEIIHKIRGEQ